MNADGSLQQKGDRVNRTFISSVSSKPSFSCIRRLQQVAHMHSRCSAVLTSISPVLDDAHFGKLLQSKINVSMTKSSKHQSSLTPEKLARTWLISRRRAQNTLKATTQRATMTLANPAISRRFKTNDHSLKYNRIPHKMFGDTLQSKV